MYHLFGHNRFYPSGGMNDYIDSFDTIEKAKEEASTYSYDDFDIVIQRDGDYIKPSSLEVVEYADTKWVDGELIIEWNTNEDLHPTHQQHS